MHYLPTCDILISRYFYFKASFSLEMADDFFNGLSVVPLDTNHSILSSIAVSDAHPWRDLYQKREPPPDYSTNTPSTKHPPFMYKYEDQLLGPPLRTTRSVMTIKPKTRSSYNHPYALTKQITGVEWHQTIRLCDVEAFRKSTAEKARANASLDPVNALSAGFSRLTTSSSSIRPLIYRYVDVTKNSFALLEAIHFELFLPDRHDLRFLAVRFSSVPSGTVEGDFFRLSEADLLSDLSFAVKLGEIEYPVLWEVKRITKMYFSTQNDEDALAYIVKKKARSGGETAISDASDWDFFIREKLFPDKESRSEHSLVRVSMKDMLTGHLYPVEPPLPPPPPPPPLSFSQQMRIIAEMTPDELSTTCTMLTDLPLDTTAKKLMFLNCMLGDENLMEMLTELESSKAEEKFDPRSEYLKRVSGVLPSSQHAGGVVSAVRALSATEVERIEDRLGAFTTYGQRGDLELMDQLFRLGSRYRVFASSGADADVAGETRIDEGVVLKTLMDDDIGILENCRPLLDCIYGRRGADDATASAMASSGLDLVPAPFRDGSALQLNPAQSRAVRLYADADGPRVFCILSPPGSGKTTVAAAMAAEVARTMHAQRRERRYGYKGQHVKSYDHYSSLQLLLSVQNVAVDNMGAALKKMDYGGGQVYNMKSSKKLNPADPAPYDFFDRMSESELASWKHGTIKLSEEDLRNLRMKKKEKRKKKDKNKEKKKQREMEECITHHRREFEKSVCPKILLSTVEMVLQKMYTESKLNDDLERVRRVIIDEASLLTEAALFAIIRRFPQARIVLIGDDHQLPPFMFDEKILGHELAGRPALTVAMKTGKVPVVELNEVYRAPPSLVAPYNRLAYGGKLVSRKPESEHPLSVVGLVHSGRPQLLLIHVDGREERNEQTMSLSNTKERETLVRLLQRFPRGWAKDVMIICLYKDQKKRLQELLDMAFQPGSKLEKKYTVLTVDSAQGKEAPVVILMTTRTERATEFFCSTERCNVAVSRQQKALIVLGKAPLLTTHKPWSTVVNGEDFTRIKSEDI